MRLCRAADKAEIAAHPVGIEPARGIAHAHRATTALGGHAVVGPAHGAALARGDGLAAVGVRLVAAWRHEVGAVALVPSVGDEVEGPIAQVIDGGLGLAVRAGAGAVDEAEPGLLLDALDLAAAFEAAAVVAALCASTAAG